MLQGPTSTLVLLHPGFTQSPVWYVHVVSVKFEYPKDEVVVEKYELGGQPNGLSPKIEFESFGMINHQLIFLTYTLQHNIELEFSLFDSFQTSLNWFFGNIFKPV